MKEFTRNKTEMNSFSAKLTAINKANRDINTMWLQAYLHKDSKLFYNILKNLLDTTSSFSNGEIDILYNISYNESFLQNKNGKCVVLFC